MKGFFFFFPKHYRKDQMDFGNAELQVKPTDYQAKSYYTTVSDTLYLAVLVLFIYHRTKYYESYLGLLFNQA